MCERITRRDARLRTAAIASLAGVAVVELSAVPYALVQGAHVALLAIAVMVAAVRVATVLAKAAPGVGAAGWPAAAALGALVAGGWAVTRAVAVPGVAEDAGRWTSAPAAVAAALALAVVVLAGTAMGRPALRRGARAVAAAVAICAALAPGAATLLVALGPAPGAGHGGHGATAGHGHAARFLPVASTASFRPGFGGHAGHYVYPNARRPHLPAWALSLALGVAGAFVSTAAAGLRRRGHAPEDRDAAARPRRAPAGAVPGAAAVLACACALAGPLPPASAHARLVRAEPSPLARVATAPARIVLAFSEPVQVVRAGGVRVLDHAGRAVPTGRVRTAPRDDRVVTIPLPAGLRADSWTVRYRVLAADAHALSGGLVFAVGGAALLPPAGGAPAGPSETSPWAVDARFAELVALGGLVALLAFRWLVWGPALARVPELTGAERMRAAIAGRRAFWRAFWVVAAAAGLAEAVVLVVKTDVVFGAGLWGAVAHPAAAERLVAASRFGGLLGARGGLLCAMAVLAFWEWLLEPAVAPAPRGAGGRALPAVALGGLSVATLGLLSAQGHASQAPLAGVSIAVDAVHLGAVAVWAGGLACLAATLRRLSRLERGAGPPLARAVLRRFSRVAGAAMGVIATSGLARAAGELAAPSELWATPYGRSLVLKTLLLAPIAVLALRHRRAIAAVAVGGRPGRALLHGLSRELRAELAVAMTIVLVAAVLVAQVPGRG